MKERYAFRYNEFLQQRKEQGKIFEKEKSLNVLLCDVKARFQGKGFVKGDSSLSKLGVRVNGTFSLPENWKELTDMYGADALRIALIENIPLSDENLTGCWRFIGNLWRTLQAYNLMTNDMSDYVVYETLKKGDYKQVLLALKSAIKNNQIGRDIFKLCYPFMPHLILSFVQDIHEQMPAFYKDIQTKALPNKMFIEVNGKRIMDFYAEAKDKQEFIDEVLSFGRIKRKITNKSIKRIIFIPQKGVNIVI